MSKSIKFNHADNGELALNTGSTSLADLLTIGAVSLTAKRNQEACKQEYATDKKGLQIISEKAEHAASFFNNSTHALGVLLAHVDHNEIQDHIPQIAWLIAGLSELSEMVGDAKSDIDYELSIKDQA